jgi:hypothetical protein
MVGSKAGYTQHFPSLPSPFLADFRARRENGGFGTNQNG